MAAVDDNVFFFNALETQKSAMELCAWDELGGSEGGWGKWWEPEGEAWGERWWDAEWEHACGEAFAEALGDAGGEAFAEVLGDAGGEVFGEGWEAGWGAGGEEWSAEDAQAVAGESSAWGEDSAGEERGKRVSKEVFIESAVIASGLRRAAAGGSRRCRRGAVTGGVAEEGRARREQARLRRCATQGLPSAESLMLAHVGVQHDWW